MIHSCQFYSWLFLILFFFFGCQIVTQFKEQGLNTELYYKNREMGETFSIVPTSAIRYNIWTSVLYLYNLFSLVSCKTCNATILIFFGC